MRKIVSAAVALAVAGAFGLGNLATAAPAAAQEQMEKAPAKKMQKTAPNKEVMALQEALNRNGAKLEVDGLMGKQTRAALRDFQEKNGLKGTGRLDKETRAKLGL